MNGGHRRRGLAGRLYACVRAYSLPVFLRGGGDQPLHVENHHISCF
jgi:hypothetical protein